MVDKKIWDKMSGSTPKVDGEYISATFSAKILSIEKRLESSPKKQA